ncbi:MAG: hypothetical protein KF729_06935 [Sandaracinaceae bacterium]|nr:hypothetical protein [Sandaracinaceae bacterium]
MQTRRIAASLAWLAIAGCGGEPRSEPGLAQIDWTTASGEGPATPARPAAIDVDWLDFGASQAIAPTGPTAVIDWAYVARATLERRYGAVTEAVYALAVDRESGRAYAGPIDPRSPDQPPFTARFDEDFPRDGLVSTAGARRADLRAVLGLPAEAATYDVMLFLETVASPRRTVTVPAATRAGRSTARPELERSAHAHPVERAALHPTAGCASVRVDLPANARGWVAIAAPAQVEAMRAALPAEDRGRQVLLRGCDGLEETPRGGRLHAFALALVEHEERVTPVGPVALSPDVFPLDAATSSGCAADRDCVLIGGVCGGPQAVRRADAPERAQRHYRMASVAECARVPEIAPSEARCEDGGCRVEPLDEPAWRSCRRARDCVAVPRRCGEWTAVNRSRERDATERWAAAIDCPALLSPPPELTCFWGFCALADGVHVYVPAP